MTRLVETVAKRAGIDDLEEHLQDSGDNSHKLAITQIVQEALHDYAGPSRKQQAAHELDGMLANNSVLYGQVSRLIVTEEVHRKTHHEMSGRLDRRALVRMRTGAPDVFSRRDDTPGIDTAVTILIDGSGSMCSIVHDENGAAMPMPDGSLHTRMSMAQVTAWHLAKAIESAGAKVSIVLFESISRSPQIMVQMQGKPCAKLITVKDWHHTCTDAAARIRGLEGHTFTPLSPAIIGAAEGLATVQANRRILLVLTDGQCDMGTQAVTAACNLAQDMYGVETVGLGMNCADVIAAFPPRYSVNVESLDQLATTGMGLIADMLEDANPRGTD